MTTDCGCGPHCPSCNPDFEQWRLDQVEAAFAAARAAAPQWIVIDEDDD